MSRSLELERTVASIGPLFAFLESYLNDRAIDEETASCIKLSADELFTNMVRHNVGCGDRISVLLDISDDRIRLELTDHDVEPFDPDSVPPVDVHLPVSKRQPGGLGMHLVRSVVDHVSYAYDNRELKVSVVKKLAEQTSEELRIDITDGMIRLSGRFTAEDEERAREALSGVSESAVVDLSGLEYISSAGLGILFAVQKRLLGNGNALTLVNLGPHVKKVFRLANFGAVFGNLG